MTEAQVVITVTVVTGIPEQVTRTIEAFARAAAGLALEGVWVEITTTTPPEDDDE